MKSKNKKFIILFSVVAAIIILLLVIQLIIGSVLKSKIENALSKKENPNYSIDIGKVKVNLFTMTLIFKEVAITPDSVFITELKSPNFHKQNAFEIKIPVVRIRNIGVFNYLFNKEIGVNDFIINKADVCLYKSVSNNELPHESTKPASTFKTDSIVIPGINGVVINNVLVNNFSFKVINLKNNDTTFNAKNLDLSYQNIELVKNKKDKNSLRLLVTDVEIKMTKEEFNLPGGKYSIAFDNLSMDVENSKLVFDNLKIKPQHSLSKMAKMSKFQYEIYTCDIKKLEVYSIVPSKILATSDVIISNIVVDSMNLSIYKDKHFPFDTTKRPKLPVQALKLLKDHLYIDSIIIKNSELTYSELHDKIKTPMVVNLGNFNVVVSNITNIKDSIAKKPVMAIKLKAKLQNAIPMGVNIYMPMNSAVDTFAFDGWLSRGNMKLFNKILLPAIGIKFDAGYLDGVKFTANANTTYSIGEITMLYHDLEGVVVQNDYKKTNKFLSWVANSAMIRNNPVVNRDVRTEPMYFDRVMYKGAGNFLWKTLQSGITATIIPTMGNKVQRQIDVVKGTDKKTIRKREREERRRKRKNSNGK